MRFYRACSVRERAKVPFKWATVCNVPKFRLNNGKCYLLTAGFREYRVRTQGLISQVLILKPSFGKKKMTGCCLNSDEKKHLLGIE